MTLTIRPPAPMPWIARKAMSSVIPGAAPQSAEPARKMTMDTMKIVLRLNRSPSLPQIGVPTVVPRMYAVVTQARCSSPPSSPTMVGRAGATIMLSSIARSIATIRPDITTRISRCDRSGGRSSSAISAVCCPGGRSLPNATVPSAMPTSLPHVVPDPMLP